jgi:hypothetical protein
MFERTRVDNAPSEQNAVPAEVTLADGRVLAGRLIASTSRTPIEMLNGAGAFLEFEPYGGERQFLAKASLAAVRLVAVPASENLAQRVRDADGFDPHQTLGVRRDASVEDVRRAYHEMAKAYHPDRYATAELPAEVKTYLATMARRINTAFALIEQSQAALRQRAQSPRAEPIYQSRPRA